MESNDKEFGSPPADVAGPETEDANHFLERPVSWKEYLASAPRASDDFMENVEELPEQEREMWTDADSA